MRATGFSIGLVVFLSASGLVRAQDVFNMGGTRDPVTGAWTGLASLEFVTVGDAGNTADATGFGAVSYTYQMGKYDVTAAQYCQFLNAVAKSDPFHLYDQDFVDGIWGCGITRTGSPGSYSYSTSIFYGYPVNNSDFPVNYINWAMAARFCNWLTNGQPTGPEGAGTTETGSYTLNGAMDDANFMRVTRNASAKYVIPTENEWYKAAYYKGGSTNAGYWVYPTQSNTLPSNAPDPNGTNNANSYNGRYTDPMNGLTDVGAFAASPGPYGTFDMGGDVWQWNEANYTSAPFRARGQRGGSFEETGDFMSTTEGSAFYPHSGLENFGFRVAEVPEPVSAAVIVVGSLLLSRRRARRS
jgi:formylglycine-generating enzyme required for sulfatase activity